MLHPQVTETACLKNLAALVEQRITAIGEGQTESTQLTCAIDEALLAAAQCARHRTAAERAGRAPVNHALNLEWSRISQRSEHSASLLSLFSRRVARQLSVLTQAARPMQTYGHLGR